MMRARLIFLPVQKGTKELVRKHGDTLLCVRYRYDEATDTRIKPDELIVEKKPSSPPAPRYRDEELVPVRIAYNQPVTRGPMAGEPGDPLNHKGRNKK